MNNFEGMRWFKCDFQVQTPEDGAHWLDTDTRLPEPRRPTRQLPNGPDGAPRGEPDESLLQEGARRYLRRCHELELEVIGVTDHNFSQKTDLRDWFLTHLVEQNKSVARDLGRAPIHIFPGFEVDIGYHVLCLFEPATKAQHIWRVNKLLCKLGLDESERFRQAQPVPLRRNQANVSLKELLELVQEEFGGIVIAAHADQNSGLLQDPRHIEDYKNRKLLALEVTSAPPAQRIRDIVTGKDRAWSRPDFHPAYVMSSDAKSLKVDVEGQPVANSLGYRHTWLRMSKPSIEALRQAFLDSESRIRLLGSRPSETLHHPRITEISITGAAFLVDQQVALSEHLNCIIGGRGSGKSSLVEYLRFAVGDVGTKTERFDDDQVLARKRKQLRQSLPDGSEVRISFEIGTGVSDTLVYRPGRTDGPERWVADREVADLNTVIRQLHLQFFGQGELSRMTSGENGQAQVLALLDASVGTPLSELNAKEQELRGRLKGLYETAREARRLKAEHDEALQETVELERQLKAREALKEDARLNSLALEAKQYIEELREDSAPIIAAITDAATTLEIPLVLQSDGAGDWPNAAWFASTTNSLQKARSSLASSLRVALRNFEQAVGAQLGDDAIKPTITAIELLQQGFRTACAERGLQEDDIEKMQGLGTRRQDRLRVVEAKKKQLVRVQEEADKFPGVLAELHCLWRDQYKLRSQNAAAIEASVASQTVRLVTEYMADRASYKAAWSRLAPTDRRGKLARRWDDVGDKLFASWHTRMDASAWETLEVMREEAALLADEALPGLQELHESLFAYLDSENVLPLWEDVRLSRVSDGIDVQLLRDDGSLAGSMNGSLSEGQRNTVLLNLILARGEGPIIIDQPEDELDSSFIYRTLVRDLRAVKERRQLIVVTHNANLPVNADAELIYALEARDGRGKVVSQGGLDRKSLARTVLDVMEGSETAFRRRSDKYHF